MKRDRNKKSFTLIETVVAALLLSISVVLLAGISVRSLQTARSISLYEQAWDLVNRQFTMVDYIGISTFIENAPTEGTFEANGIEYDWTLNISEAHLEYLYDVTVTVGWNDDRRYKTIQAQTRFSGYE